MKGMTNAYAGGRFRSAPSSCSCSPKLGFVEIEARSDVVEFLGLAGAADSSR
jgi:hypothetical protein